MITFLLLLTVADSADFRLSDSVSNCSSCPPAVSALPPAPAVSTLPPAPASCVDTTAATEVKQAGEMKQNERAICLLKAQRCTQKYKTTTHAHCLQVIFGRRGEVRHLC